MLRCKGRDAFIDKFLSGELQSISDRENARIEDADNVSRVGFFHNFSFIRHHLRGLRKLHLSAALDMIDFHSGIKLTGTDPHESHSVSVLRIHIGLNLKDKGGKCFLHRVDESLVGHSRERGLRHFQEMLQEGFHAEVRKS